MTSEAAMSDFDLPKTFVPGACNASAELVQEFPNQMNPMGYLKSHNSKTSLYSKGARLDAALLGSASGYELGNRPAGLFSSSGAGWERFALYFPRQKRVFLLRRKTRLLAKARLAR